MMKTRRMPWTLYATDWQRIRSHPYAGKGTKEEPFLIYWLAGNEDPENPQSWPTVYKWTVTFFATLCSFGVFFCSSGFVSDQRLDPMHTSVCSFRQAGGMHEMMEDFHVSNEIVLLGVSLFVLGFAIGPLFFAPLSEVMGRRIVFIGTYGAMTAFNAGATASQNIQTLLIMRFLAGTFGSSLLTNVSLFSHLLFPWFDDQSFLRPVALWLIYS